MIIRPDYHLTVGLNYEHNRVTLPGASFTTDLVATRFTYSFTPRALINAFIQYNADTHEVSSNIQLRITHHPLSDLYLVYNEGRDTANGQPVERASHRQVNQPVQVLAGRRAGNLPTFLNYSIMWGSRTRRFRRKGEERCRLDGTGQIAGDPPKGWHPSQSAETERDGPPLLEQLDEERNPSRFQNR